MSAKPTPDREMILARIARALGCAGYSVEECDAIMGWVQAAHPANPNRIPCRPCGSSGRAAAVEPDFFASDEDKGMLSQGVCLACRGRGFNT